MDNLIINLLLFASICTEDAWGINLGHNSLKEMGGESRIKGGEEVEIEDHPYAAVLEIQTKQSTSFCGGAIITKYHIVTAAECIDGADLVKIRVGSKDKTANGQKYTTSDYMVHPMYTAGEKYYDVGVLIIVGGIEFDGSTVGAIHLTEFGDEPIFEEEVTICGWGKTGPKLFDETLLLMEATMEVVDKSQCGDGGQQISDSLFCAIDKEGQIAACKGDLGNPAIIDGALAGVVSRTTKCKPEEAQPITDFGDPVVRTFLMTMTRK